MKKLLLSLLLTLPLIAQVSPSKALLNQRGTLADIPATCEPGQLYFATDQTPGANIYGCTSGNTWTVNGSGGGGSMGAAGVVQASDGSGGFQVTSVTDNGTTVTSTEPVAAPSVATGASPPTCTAGTGGVICFNEGTVPSVGKALGIDVFYADSTQHGFKASYNNGSYLPLVQGPASATNGHLAVFSGTNGGLLADGGAVPSAATYQITLGVGSSDISTTGTKACTVISSSWTIVSSTLISNVLPTGANLVVDILKVAGASYTGFASASSITASDVPTITTGASNPITIDSTLTGWTTAISAGDVLCVAVKTAPTGGSTSATLTLAVQ